jgi:hypothetical protein
MIATIFFLATALALPAAVAVEPPCTTGTPVVTYGYTINYAEATPTAMPFGQGYQPEPAWGSSHVVATYVSSVPGGSNRCGQYSTTD